MPSTLHIFGVRHHGPGCARSLQRALDELQPDIVLIEGPPEADDLLAAAAERALKPPVALLIYGADNPKHAAFYPFAVFSPEWQAIQHGVHRKVPVRFMDLPMLHRFAMDEEALVAATATAAPNEADGEPAVEPLAEVPADATPESLEADINPYIDPLSHLARAANYPDPELWWDHLIESRSGHKPGDIFPAILEAMTALRESLPPRPDRYEARREAHMRKTIRAAMKEGHGKIAIVCGAWHAPVLLADKMPPAKQDNDLLKDLPKLKTAAAWIPWTYGRLASASGYGAGVTSPGYYHHLWRHTEAPARNTGGNAMAISWLTNVAQLLRAEDLDASSAHIIETVRLAESLAAVRNRPAPSLAELTEATRTVLLFGDEAQLGLIHRKLIVSDRLGEVPADGAVAPLQLDLQRQQKRLRLPPDPAQKTLELDLRKPNDLERSQLLHRMNLLGVPWGGLKSAGNVGTAKGTFKELWQTQWEPEFAVRLIDASTLGNTVYDAASASARRAAAGAGDLPPVTALLDRALQAALPEAVSFLLRRIDALAAVAADLLHMMEALPPLANVIRYGNVRKADTGLLSRVVETLLTRVTVGVPVACASLDDAAAERMEKAISHTHQAVQLLYPAAQAGADSPNAQWSGALRKLADQSTLHGLLAGRATRLLLDTGNFTGEEAATRMSLALSAASEPAHAAAWIEGFLKGSGLILLHDHALWAVLDAWVEGLSEEHFTGVLPFLRRSFSQFAAPERQQMGRRAKAGRSGGGPGTGRAASAEAEVDSVRAARVLPILMRILGNGEVR